MIHMSTRKPWTADLIFPIMAEFLGPGLTGFGAWIPDVNMKNSFFGLKSP